jgi:hypothetical protein
MSCVCLSLSLSVVVWLCDWVDWMECDTENTNQLFQISLEETFNWECTFIVNMSKCDLGQCSHGIAIQSSWYVKGKEWGM